MDYIISIPLVRPALIHVHLVFAGVCDYVGTSSQIL